MSRNNRAVQTFLSQAQALLWAGSQVAQGTPNLLNHYEQFLQHTHSLQKWPAVGMTQRGEQWVVTHDQKRRFIK